MCDVLLFWRVTGVNMTTELNISSCSVAANFITGMISFIKLDILRSHSILVDRYNLFEIGLWGWGGLGFVIYAFIRRGCWARLSFSTGLLLIAFAFSDSVELITGAWWSPWWLLCWKSLNIAALFLNFILYRQKRVLLGKLPARVS